MMSRESSRGNVSGYYRNLGSLRAGTRHHGGRRARNGEFSVMSRSRSQGTEVTIVTGDVFVRRACKRK